MFVNACNTIDFNNFNNKSMLIYRNVRIYGMLFDYLII